MNTWTIGNFRFVADELTIDYLGNGYSEQIAVFVHAGNGYNMCFIEDKPFYVPRDEFMSFSFKVQLILDMRYDDENNLKQ